jgi:AraC-like DNA-binding protein
VTRDWPVGRTTRELGGQLRHGILVAPVTRIFEDLGVAASLSLDDGWLEIHDEPNLLGFEMEHGAVHERWTYNARCIDRARRTRAAVLGQHRGFFDLFVPVPGEPVRAVIVSGPFADARLTTTDVLERWRSLTGRQGHPSDPEFSQFLSVALSTLVLDSRRQAQFRRVLECFAALMVSEGPISRLVSEVASLTKDLREVRSAELVWQVVREVVDERTNRVWSRPYRHDRQQRVGLLRFPDHLVVGLFVSRHRDADPVDHLIRTDAFQRACVDLGRQVGDVVSGRIGNHGVTFLCAGRGPAQRVLRRLVGLGERAATLAGKRYGLDLHFGVSTLSLPLPAQFRAALAAAETALSEGLPFARAEVTQPTLSPLWGLRRELAKLVEENPSALPARFDGYVAAVAAHCRYEQEPCRAHLDVALERMAEVLLGSSALEHKSVEAIAERVQRSASAVQTIDELFAAYRRAAADLAGAVDHPTPARRDRNLRRAVEFLREHYAERLTLKRVARVSGFAPNYFAELFRSAHRTTFAKYVMQLRLQRAQELLAATSLSLDRIAQLSGLTRRQHLIRAFQRELGETPVQYRRRVLDSR